MTMTGSDTDKTREEVGFVPSSVTKTALERKERMAREAALKARRDAADKMVSAAFAKGGLKALRCIHPLALRAEVDTSLDLTDPSLLLTPCVRLAPVVNPLLDAVMLKMGASPSGSRTYAISMGDKSPVKPVEAMLEALPLYVAYSPVDVADAAKNGGFHTVQRANATYNIRKEISSSPLGEKLSALTLHHWIMDDRNEPPLGAGLILSSNGKQLYVKICTVPLPGTKRADREEGLYIYEDAPNLDLLTPSEVKDPIMVTPGVALAVMESAHHQGLTVINPDRKMHDFRAILRASVTVQSVPGSPAKARVMVGEDVAGLRLKGLEAPGEGVLTLRSADLGVKQVSTVIARAEGDKSIVSAIDVSVRDVIAMHDARPTKIAGMRPFQNEVIALHAATQVGYLNACAPGLGKGHPVDTEVLTPQGLKRVGDLRVGDPIMGRDGKATQVTGVFPKGVLPVFRVTFSDGASVLCDQEHLWNVREKGQTRSGAPRAERVMSLDELQNNLSYPAGTDKWRIPVSEPLHFENQGARPVPAYTLGALLGDGCQRTKSVKIYSEDPELVGFMAEELGSDYQVVRQQWMEKTPEYRFVTRPNHAPNPLRNGLEELGLWGKGAFDKFIPQTYLFAPLAERRLLLQGLMDTDGSVATIDNHLEFCSCSEQLSNDVRFLVQSLGGTAKIARGPSWYNDKQGERVEAKDRFRVSIALPASEKPFRLARKADVYHPRAKYQPTRIMRSIEPEGQAEVVCISVAAEDRLYLTENCIVTHNTVTTLKGMQIRAAEKGKGYKAIVVAPAAIRTQWTREAARFFPEAVVADVPGKGMKENLDRLFAEADGRPALAIMSYNAGSSGIAAICEHEWDDAVVDEAKILASPSSQRTLAMWELRRHTQVGVALTGTPIDKSLDELGLILAWARDDRTLFHGAALSKRFDMSEEDGVKELWNSIGPTVFRRDRSEIADELPKIDTEVIVMDPAKAELNLAQGARNQLKEIYENLLHKVEEAREFDPSDPRLAAAEKELRELRGAVLGGVTLARMAASDPAAVGASDSVGAELLKSAGLVAPAVKAGGTKRTQIVGLTADLVENGSGVLIFTDFSSVAVNLKSDFDRLGVSAGLFTGEQAQGLRDRNVVAFQGTPCEAHKDEAGSHKGCPDCLQPTIDVLVMTKAAREGLNLQRADVLIHFDVPWVPSEMVQRVGRATRIGSTNEGLSVLIPIMAGTIEERVAAVLVPRAIVAMQALDTHRGAKASETEMGLAIKGLEGAVSAGERAGKESLFTLAAEILKD